MKKLLCVALGGHDAGEELSELLKDWQVLLANGLREAGHALRARHYLVGVLLFDTQSTEKAALDLFLREHWWMKWVAISGPTQLESPQFRELVHEHCFDYHTWPLDSMRLRHTLGHALGVATLHPAPGPPCADRSRPLTGNSRAVNELRQHIGKVALADAPVLIWGESGTGKELVARAVHNGSARAAGPFVPINCGAMPTSLIQSELFGHQRGAFTGAARDKAGLLETAAGGTVFLDEIGDLPMEQQANMLRFLQEKTVCRLGSTTPRSVDVRVIAASHVRLSEAVADGRFREDLYYRLAVLTLDVPPLRARGADVVALADYYFHEFASERSRQVRGFSRQALAAMQAYSWPGNVRELVNRVRRASVMAERGLIQPADLGLDGAAPLAVDALDEARVRAERTAIEQRLGEGKSMAQVAQELGVSRMTLYRLLAKHGIERPGRRPGLRG